MSNSISRKSPSAAHRWLKPLFGLARALAAVATVIALFSLVDWAMNGENATFWTKQNLQTISVQNAFVAIASIGMLLVMIAGGIDLSAGVALALCATVLAWGLREDVGFLIAHGENVSGATHRLKEADEALKSVERQTDTALIQKKRAELESARKRLSDLLLIKVEQLRSQWSGIEPGTRENLIKSISSLKNQLLDSRIGDREGLEQLLSRQQTALERIDLAKQQLDEAEKALTDVKNPAAPIESDPSWLRLLPNAAASTWLALAMGIGSGMLCGLLNGLLVVVLRIVPFIATLGTMTIFLGLAKIVADETAVRPDGAQVPQWMGELSAVRPDPSWLLVSKGVWLALILAAIMACILRYTVFGRYVFALGSNESTARLCGINVPLVKIAIYTLSGLLVGIAAVCFFARLNSGNPTSGTGLELKFIAAVVIGGGSLNGGRGSVLGTLAGTIIMGVIVSGCTLLGIRNPAQDIILGMIIIAAVTVDQLRKQTE